jgi:hypothetical protein
MNDQQIRTCHDINQRSSLNVGTSSTDDGTMDVAVLLVLDDRSRVFMSSVCSDMRPSRSSCKLFNAANDISALSDAADVSM